MNQTLHEEKLETAKNKLSEDCYCNLLPFSAFFVLPEKWDEVWFVSWPPHRLRHPLNFFDGDAKMLVDAREILLRARLTNTRSVHLGVPAVCPPIARRLGVLTSEAPLGRVHHCFDVIIVGPGNEKSASGVIFIFHA